MSQLGRPRPKPRLVTKRPPAATSGGPTPQVASGSSTSADKFQSTSSKSIQDEDDLFRRNRGRTAQHWKQLHQFAQKTTSSDRTDDNWECDDSVDESSPRRRKKKQNRQNDLPRWQATDVATLLSSDNDENDLQIIESLSGNEGENTSHRKRKRERSRSKSITPPPALPAHHLANAQNLVRQALAIEPRAPSPTHFADDSIDTIVLDPELAKIAEAVRKQALNSQLDMEQVGGPEIVTIKVRWRPHPLNSSAEKHVWVFKMQRYDTFRDLFEGVADLAAVLVDQLVVSHDNRRVFASGTPHSIRIWAEGELEACDKHTYEYIRTHHSQRSPSPSLQDKPHSSRCSLSVSPRSDAESEAESTGGEKIKLIFRSAATKDKTFPLIVRPNTTCGAIVKAFLKAARLPDNYSHAASRSKKGNKYNPYPQLMIDGDKMACEAEIGDADLEDGDLVEIVGIDELLG
ncbi:hypothetical protein PAXRUDRAFT_13704 [Paxillus rubicundulus Ve08.2h10]|uniref:Rad60/SUMO-like domain-containing protein n=1 Tax=Paxillus rubicundulus Ve08.2h10 TaxID=930991 RepID=A0A0D0DT34_9AGAM|nr:hypothetical protein PAXRUDRAFT_13704 [Paxillus rubicundulus Ve08.2h10]